MRAVMGFPPHHRFPPIRNPKPRLPPVSGASSFHHVAAVNETQRGMVAGKEGEVKDLSPHLPDRPWSSGLFEPQRCYC
jgi:hypothetical protein